MTTHPTVEPEARAGCHGCGPRGCRCCETPEACDLECVERPMFTAGMVLSDTDLTALVDWTGARLGLLRHRDGWGVVCGLDVHCDPDRPGSVVVDPGYAVGCCGEDVVLCEPRTVDLTGCCATDSPCGEPATDPKAPPVERDPCGDVVVDIVLSPLASPAVPELPELVDTCGCGCEREARVVPTRLRESGLVEPVRVAFPRGDPRGDAADRAQAAYRACSSIVRAWVEAGEKGDPSRDDVVAWLRLQVVDPPCDWWDTTCGALAGVDADGAEQVEQVMARSLLDLVVGCRHRLLRRPCGTCESDRVGLARAWLRRVEGKGGTSCVVTRVDAYPPHRRELGQDPRAVPPGAQDLAPFIWQRWEEVCNRWRRLAGRVPASTVDVPADVAGLLALLESTDRLWWACEDPAPEPVVLDVPCLGTRVIGFRDREGGTDDAGRLEDVRGIGPAFAKQLLESGTSTIEELTMLEPPAIAVVLGVSEPVAQAIWLDAVNRVRGMP